MISSSSGRMIQAGRDAGRALEVRSHTDSSTQKATMPNFPCAPCLAIHPAVTSSPGITALYNVVLLLEGDAATPSAQFPDRSCSPLGPAVILCSAVRSISSRINEATYRFHWRRRGISITGQKGKSGTWKVS